MEKKEKDETSNDEGLSAALFEVFFYHVEKISLVVLNNPLNF